MNKLLSIKETSAIFLAIVLLTGTIALSYPSSLMTTVQAQPYYDYGGMDNRHDSYGPTVGYPSEYTDRNRDYNSYEPKVKNYGNDNSYEPKVKNYGNDNSDRKSYGKDSYKSQYQSYKPDYKPQYPSYGKDNRDKSKDSSKSVDIKKINCINTNLNINGNNTGDINIGNKGQIAAEGYSGAYSSGSGGYGSGEGYYDGNYKKDKDITCIINNNNNNTNVVAGGGGNVTDGNGNETDACEDCFENLTSTQISALLTLYRATGSTSVTSIEALCDLLSSTPNSSTETTRLITNLGTAGVNATTINEIIRCLVDLGVITPPLLVEICGNGIDDDLDGAVDVADPDCIAGGILPLDINTDSNINNLQITQGTEDSSALEKIAKLKQQWLDLLP